VTAAPQTRALRGRGRRWFFRLSLAFMLLSVTLGGGELLVRIVAPQPLNGRWSEMSPNGLLVNRASWSARHQKGDVVVSYRINEHHLRGGPIGPGKRVLVLGDSFTFGWLLPEEDTYVHLLAERADAAFGAGRVQVLNGGRGGWGAADYLAFLEEFGDDVAPDAVLVFLNFADIHRSVGNGLYRLTDADHLVLERQSRPPSALRRFSDHSLLFDWLLAHSQLTHAVRNGSDACKRKLRSLSSSNTAQVRDGEPAPLCALPASPTSGGPSGSIVGRALFHRLHDWCRQHGVPLAVVTTGYQARFLHPPESGSVYDLDFLRAAPDFFAAEGVPFRDFTPDLAQAVQGSWQDYLICNDGHPNAAGARLVAGQVWPWLQPQLSHWLGSAAASR
jgi:lysophospholipase L1-like esterase